jgi:hypothetical protein
MNRSDFLPLSSPSPSTELNTDKLLSKDQIAFSQPTENGDKLAQSFFGSICYFVYED